MWHGAQVRLHEGTSCQLEAPGRDFDGAQVKIAAFVADKNKWRVTLEARQWQGKELLVPESALSLSFCVMPGSVSRVKPSVKLCAEEAQGTCGRGLVVAQPVDAGEVLYEEPPLIVSPAGVPRMQSDRWRAYLMMSLQAQQRADMATARDAFDALGISNLVDEKMDEHAHTIFASAVKSAGMDVATMDEAVVREQVARVKAALSRFNSNQFKYDNGAPAKCPRFSASAVFAFTSRMNHSCEPAAFVETRKAAHAPGTLVTGDGVLVVRALRKIREGERLTINYGPADLVTADWTLARRREYLLSKCGFVCGCERCEREARGVLMPEPPPGCVPAAAAGVPAGAAGAGAAGAAGAVGVVVAAEAVAARAPLSGAWRRRGVGRL